MCKKCNDTGLVRGWVNQQASDGEWERVWDDETCVCVYEKNSKDEHDL